MSPSHRFRFGVFEVDAISGELRKQGSRIRLQEQPFQALLALLKQPGQILTREELQNLLWPSGTTVDFERGINKAINRIREVLGDSAESPRFVETVPQRGYRFIAPVEVLESPHEPTLVPPATGTLPDRRLLYTAASVLLAIAAIALGYRQLSPPLRSIESIAVLPLENLSGDIAQEYFSEGMTDSLIGEIARISSLRVISRTSIMQYKGAARKSLPTIARELNVDAILEGTVVQSGQKVRITAQLIRAQDDRHLWSEKYERNLTDLLAVQSEVARAIASQIEIKLTPQEQTYLSRKRPVRPEAYEAFLKGSFFAHQGIRGIGKSLDFFDQAITLDPSEAEFHAALAEALCSAGIFGLRPSEIYLEARAAAQRALELDEASATAHNALADVSAGYDWDMARAEVEYKRALQLNPSYFLARVRYAEYLTRMGRHEEALEQARRALALDPVSPSSQTVQAMIFYRTGHFDEAIRASQQALELDPNFALAMWWQGLSYAGKRDLSNSIASLTKAVATDGAPLLQSALAHVYGLAGEKVKAREILRDLTLRSEQGFVSPVDIAVIHAGLGDADATFLWLEKGYKARATRLQEIRSPYFESFRSDPRYADLIRRVGLPPADYWPK